MIRRNVDTHLGKALRADQDRPAEIVGRTFRHAAEEADWIAREIAALRQEGLRLGEIAVLARSLREIGPRLAYTLRTHEISFHAPLAPQLHPSADALLSLLELAAAYPWEPAHDDDALRVLASPLFGANPLELRRYRREPRTLYGALREAGDFEPFFEALAIVKRQRTAGAAIYALWERLEHFRALESPAATREQVEELAAVTALSDAANEFDGPPAEFPTAFREGELETRRLAAVRAGAGGRRRAPDRAPGEGARVGRGLRLRPRRGQVSGARALAVRALRPRGFRRRARRRGRARPPRARGGAAPLLRRADAGPHDS